MFVTGSNAIKATENAPLSVILLSSSITVSYLPQSKVFSLPNYEITKQQYLHIWNAKKKVNLFGNEIRYRDVLNLRILI